MSFVFPFFFPLTKEAYYISSAYFQSHILTSQISPSKLLAKFHGFNAKSEFSGWHVMRNTKSAHMFWNVQSFLPTVPELSKNRIKFEFSIINKISNFDIILVFWPSDCSDKYQRVLMKTPESESQANTNGTRVGRHHLLWILLNKKKGGGIRSIIQSPKV